MSLRSCQQIENQSGRHWPSDLLYSKTIQYVTSCIGHPDYELLGVLCQAQSISILRPMIANQKQAWPKKMAQQLTHHDLDGAKQIIQSDNIIVMV